MLFYKTTRIFIASILISSSLLLASCYKEVVVKHVTPKTGLHFYMSDEQMQAIHDAHNVKLDIKPEPKLIYQNEEFEVSDFELRGESALRFRKKSFNLRTVVPLEFKNENISETTVALRDIKLISLVSDYTYIENRIAFGLLKKISLQPLFYKFEEVSINDNTQGLYLLFESPAEYLRKQNHECLLRRGRNGAIADSWFYANFSGNSENDYMESFNNIYKMITEYSGSQLYDGLTSSMNLTNYFRRTAVDLLLQNGDTSDEVYFVATNKSSEIYFDIIPWDCDDMFKELPHEIGQNFAIGTRFGERSYSTMDDVIADVGEKLIFSIEDDFDYIIAKDTFLYKKYLSELDYVLNIFNESIIDEIFNHTRSELTPHLTKTDIIEQTKYCATSFTFEDFNENIEAKRDYVKQRRSSLIAKLNEHKQLYEVP